jgi:hypothetical protein
MPNAVKYSTTKINNSIKKGNVVLGINNIEYAPTSTTGYWNGITPPISGYTIYVLPSGSTTPSIVCPVTDADVIYWAKSFGGGSNITTRGLALQYITSALTNTIVINENYPNIITSGMAINLDTTFVPSYPISGTTIYDISGNGTTGTITSGNFTNNVIYFDGANTDITCSNSTAIDNLSASTYSILYNWTEDVSVTSTSLLYKSDDNNNAGWFINIDSSFGGIGFTKVRPTNAEYYLPSSQTPARNRWTHLTVTWTGGLTTFGDQVKIYINGVEDTTAPQSLDTGTGTPTSDSAEPLNIGNSRPGSAWHFGGYISNVNIYNRVLSAVEIAQNYYQSSITTSGLTLMSDAANLVSYFTGTTWYDLTANKYIGTLNNTPTFYRNGITFNGTNQFASYNYTGGTTDSYTFTCWVKTDSVAGKVFVGRGRDSFGNGWSVYLGTSTSNNPAFNVVTTTPSTASILCEGVSTLATNTWYFLAGTWNPGVELKVYINGVLDKTTATTSTNLRTSTTGINLATLSNTAFYSCTIGSFAIYNRVLSAAEIANNYSATRDIYT